MAVLLFSLDILRPQSSLFSIEITHGARGTFEMKNNLEGFQDVYDLFSIYVDKIATLIIIIINMSTLKEGRFLFFLIFT